MRFKERFNVFWDRLSRSTPLFGIVASILFIPARLEIEANEDTAYRALIEKMGAEPQFPYHSVQREKKIIVGEILARLLVLAIACALPGVFVRFFFPFFSGHGSLHLRLIG